MCLIIYTPKKELLNWDVMESAHFSNDDGWGIMFPDVKNERMVVSRHYDPEPKAAWAKFKKTMSLVPDDVQIGIHFRIKTHGSIHQKNCHPFLILSKKYHGHDLYLMHNGTISNMDTNGQGDDRSDTAIFAEEFMRPMLKGNPSFMNGPRWQKVVKDIIGFHSRLLFMRGDGSFWICNKAQGTEKDGVWYSNSYSLHREKKVENTTTTNNYGEYGPKNNRSHNHFNGQVWSDTKRTWVDKDSRHNIQDNMKHMLENMGFEIQEDGVFLFRSAAAKVTLLNAVKDVKKTNIVDLSTPPEEITKPGFDKGVTESGRVRDSAAVIDAVVSDPEREPSTLGVFFSDAWAMTIKQQSESEVYHSVVENPSLAREYMFNNGFYASRITIDAFINQYPEDAATWIFHRAQNHVDKLNQLDFIEAFKKIQSEVSHITDRVA